MQLSIIIVNYNSRLLIGQCIISVQKAIQNINAEIIVVDNNSQDDSKAYLPAKFPGIKYIFNDHNLGFAKACNKGFGISSGKYVLFLNPDTILSETSLAGCISFLETHPGAGAIGVRMINDKGKFLKESKRGDPTPSASFYKLFGLSSVFPTSKTFSRYHQGHLRENENSEVDVLSGAFMMMNRDIFKAIRGFDEDFFMYGEDIDLCVRIRQAGYKNYYLGTISVTHLKGGSTTYNKKYVKDFYDAMRLFVKKHYRDKPAGYRWLLNSGIEIRQALASVALLFR